MKKINCIFFDDDIIQLKSTIEDFIFRHGKKLSNYYELNTEIFAFEYFDSRQEHKATDLVKKWKGKYEFVAVDARASGDNAYTAVAEALIDELKEQNIRYCVFTSDVDNLKVSGKRKFKDSFVFKKEEKAIAEIEKKEKKFHGNFFDMLLHIQNSDFRFFEIIDHLNSDKDKKIMRDFLKSQYNLEKNVLSIKIDDFGKYILSAREIFETIYMLLRSKRIIPEHNFFINNSTNCNSYLSDMNDISFKIHLSKNMQKEDVIECDYSIFRLNDKKHVVVEDLSINKLSDKDIGETLKDTGIGNLLTFLYQFNSKDHHRSHIKMTLNDYKAILFSFNALFRRLLILIK